nr:zf-HC2 domain-containing protein [Deltaproteobacteria bacterium]
MMKHQQIDAESTVERYVTGRLTEEEAVRFEEHYLDCPRCIDNVEAAERLHRGLSEVTADHEREAIPSPTAGPLHFSEPPALSQPPPPPLAAPSWFPYAMAATVVLSLGLTLFFAHQTRQLRQDLSSTQNQLARYEEESVQGTTDPRGGELTGRLEAWKQPAANLPLALLTPMRSGQEVFPVELPRNGLWTTLWLELGGEELPAYQATLKSASGETAWRGTELRLNSLGALLILLPVDLLSPGSWELVIEGQGQPGN